MIIATVKAKKGDYVLLPPYGERFRQYSSDIYIITGVGSRFIMARPVDRYEEKPWRTLKHQCLVCSQLDTAQAVVALDTIYAQTIGKVIEAQGNIFNEAIAPLMQR